MSNWSSTGYPKSSPRECHTTIQELTGDIFVLHTWYVIREALNRALLAGMLEYVLQAAAIKMVPTFTSEYQKQIQFSCRF